jgi:hypothetical protein
MLASLASWHYLSLAWEVFPDVGCGRTPTTVCANDSTNFFPDGFFSICVVLYSIFRCVAYLKSMFSIMIMILETDVPPSEPIVLGRACSMPPISNVEFLSNCTPYNDLLFFGPKRAGLCQTCTRSDGKGARPARAYKVGPITASPTDRTKDLKILVLESCWNEDEEAPLDQSDNLDNTDITLKIGEETTMSDVGFAQAERSLFQRWKTNTESGYQGQYSASYKSRMNITYLLPPEDS